MLYRSSAVSLAVVCAVVLLVMPSHAYAYLDFGSGSFFLQLLIASLLAGSYVVKTWWRNIKATFIERYAKHKKDNSTAR